MRYYNDYEEFENANLHIARVKYAAFLYDEYKKAASHNKAVSLACSRASITGQALRTYLPEHNRKKRILRNMQIIEMRASGCSINLIAETFDICRCTVRRTIEAHEGKINRVNRYSDMKIRGRLRDDRV